MTGVEQITLFSGIPGVLLALYLSFAITYGLYRLRQQEAKELTAARKVLMFVSVLVGLPVFLWLHVRSAVKLKHLLERRAAIEARILVLEDERVRARAALDEATQEPVEAARLPLALHWNLGVEARLKIQVETLARNAWKMSRHGRPEAHRSESVIGEKSVEAFSLTFEKQWFEHSAGSTLEFEQDPAPVLGLRAPFRIGGLGSEAESRSDSLDWLDAPLINRRSTPTPDSVQQWTAIFGDAFKRDVAAMVPWGSAHVVDAIRAVAGQPAAWSIDAAEVLSGLRTLEHAFGGYVLRLTVFVMPDELVLAFLRCARVGPADTSKDPRARP
jgi:hypothetical protein